MNYDSKMSPDSLSRSARKRARTRGELLDAARALIAEHGVSGLRVSDVTERTDVALGSFYSHFDSKEAVVEAVVADTVTALAEAIAAVAADLEDPAEALSVGARRLVGLCASDPDLARLLVNLDRAETRFEHMIWPQAFPIMEQGVARGRFTVADPVLALSIAIAGVLATIRGVTEGRLAGTPDTGCAVALLRAVGLSLAEADEIAHRALPDLPRA
jgi:AcrR family transcriptional regulator